MRLLAIPDGSGMLLEASAQSSLSRAYADGAPKGQVYSAYRTARAQTILFNKYGLPRALPASESNHVKGTAIDAHMALETWLRNHPEYGWLPVTAPDLSDHWHFNYKAAYDKRQNEDTMPSAEEVASVVWNTPINHGAAPNVTAVPAIQELADVSNRTVALAASVKALTALVAAGHNLTAAQVEEMVTTAVTDAMAGLEATVTLKGS